MNSLTFNAMQFHPILSNDQQIWIPSTELSRALGYSRADAVTKIYDRNNDEFAHDMTKIIDNPQNPNLVLRVFSLRGAHLITFFARTPVAKEFRKWVLDVLEKEVLQQQIDTLVKINAEQQAELKEIVDRRAQGERRLHAEMWSRHNKHFRISRYSDLLAIHFQDAVNYLETLEVKSKGSIYIDEKQSLEMLCVHARFFQAWWHTHSPALAKLNPLLVSMLNDNMFSMSSAISGVSKKSGFTMPNYDYDHMFELKTLPHERYRLLK
ncbi:BRO-N domain-containing protein [Acinetobacter entericus]|uniref:BRO family protein n=1 Tax=Acinetobacter entericus TaxID=2989714 RepID=A0ABT3NJF8_9GAMM|nr:BRO family protein [Acinetobacter entericus]MCW8039701.1 BRO family protein [Acinetobacter entericus]